MKALQEGLPIIRTHGVKGISDSWSQKPVMNEREFLKAVWQVSEMKEARPMRRHIAGMQKWHRMGLADMKSATEALHCVDPSPGKPLGMELVAAIPMTVYSGILHFQPDLLKDNDATDRLLLENEWMAAPLHLMKLKGQRR